MKIETGIASTTHRDRVGDKFAKSALDGMADQINAKYIRHRLHHDPKQQVGVVLYGKVFELSDGEFALGVVVGTFENELEREQYVVGQANTTSDNFGQYLIIGELRLMQEENAKIPDPIPHIDKSKLSLAESLALHLDSTRVDEDGRVYQIKKFVGTTGGLRIEVYPKDHEHEPHYHVISKQRKLNARFDLNTHQLISMKSGKVRQGDIKKIQAFFQHPENAKKLNQAYESLSS